MTIPTEHAEQVTVIGWFKIAHPELRIFSIPNGAHLAGTAATRARQMKRLKSEGLETGVPDLMLPVASGGHHGLFIEMKRVKGSSTSKDQKDWKQFLTEQGYLSVICKGHAEAIALIDEYLR